ncbi:MAG: alpha-glucosidase [FCB group bacterium]|nr:alpha-glucosidase [FCB group bacterium]
MNPRITLIGAGSATFGLGTIGDIINNKSLEGSTIVLHDINSGALDRIADISGQYIREKNLPYKLEATLSREEALKGADFIIISIEVGDRFALWEQDWQIPLKYGIKQVYGENGGPGGIFHALRIIPPILDICEAVRNICPEALVINFSNPMTKIVHTVHTRYPDLNFVGLCHEVASLVEHLPKLLGVPFSNLSIRTGGLNHFSILVEATYRDSGKDAYPDILEKGPDYFSTAPASFNHVGERSLFLEILRRFQVLPITTDSHIGEYIQWAWDVADHDGIRLFYDTYKKSMLSRKGLPIELLEQGMDEEEYWRVVPIIAGILTDSGHEELAVNVPNDGFIEALPRNQIVEVPAVIDRNGIHGIKLDPYPRAFAGLLKNQVAVHDQLTEAILTGSKQAVLQALLVDPVVDRIRPVEEMLDTMLALQKPYLDYIK